MLTTDSDRWACNRWLVVIWILLGGTSMFAMASRGTATLAVLSVTLILVSCSSSDAPQPGTPAFYWSAAKETYATGDYPKTIQHLGNILTSQNDYVARAQPLMLILTSGMAHGYMDMAEAFEAGSHANHSQTTAFHRSVNNYRGSASRLSLQFAETFGNFQSKDDSVTLAFPYPTGSPNEVVILNKISLGAMPPVPEIDTAQRRAIERAVVLATCRAVGAQGDPAKAQDLLKSGDAKIPRATFVHAMATALFEQAQLYSHNKMDDPDKMRIFCSRAQDALKPLPASKETDDLNKKIQAALKKPKA